VNTDSTSQKVAKHFDLELLLITKI